MAFIVKRDIVSAPTTLPLSTPSINFTSFAYPTFPWYYDFSSNCNKTDTYQWEGYSTCYSIIVNYQTDRWVIQAGDTCDYNFSDVAYKIASNTSLPTIGYTSDSPIIIIAA
jgi:hypothetical protein